MRKATVHGYCDRPSAAPGEAISFHVSLEEPGSYRADVVRLIHGDTNPAGPGFREELVATDITGTYEGVHQATYSGSYVRIDDPARVIGDGALGVHVFAYPTTPGRGEQALISRFDATTKTGWALVVNASGYLELVVGDGERTATLTADRPLFACAWHAVSASFDPVAGTARITQRPVVNATNSLIGPVVPLDVTSVAAATLDVAPRIADAPVLLGAWLVGRDGPRLVHGASYNGKLDDPRIYGRMLTDADLATLAAGGEPDGKRLLAHWDFAEGIGPDGVPTSDVVDVAGGLQGTTVNTPARGMTGWNWLGREENFKHAPAEYGAIHFHDDDLDDCRWDVAFELVIPDDLPSDVYAVKLTTDEAEDYVPFFVLPPRGTATAKILLLIPTASYLAYANDHIAFDAPPGQAILGHTSVLAEQDFYIYEHVEFGLSTYDLHSDTSGVHITTWRRPIINMRPKFRHATGSVWQFPADLHLVDWLHALDFEFDVATDHDLQAEGVELLRRYNVVISPSHPEYYSTEMLDAYEEYLATGGRGMYLGSNGYYWIVSFDPERPWVMEVRKAESGSRAWQARPGEYHHQYGGLRGGLWRNRARPPQKIWGVGFTSEGFDRSSYYVQLPDAAAQSASWIMDGIEGDELIGDFGLAGGGAAGYEIDRYELALGTPPHALLLAASEGHSDNYPHVSEEIMFAFPGMAGTQDPQVRADIVYFDTPNGGAVFTPGSISWCGSLSHNGYANNVSRMTANVLRQFERDEPAPRA